MPSGTVRTPPVTQHVFRKRWYVQFCHSVEGPDSLISLLSWNKHGEERQREGRAPLEVLRTHPSRCADAYTRLHTVKYLCSTREPPPHFDWELYQALLSCLSWSFPTVCQVALHSLDHYIITLQIVMSWQRYMGWLLITGPAGLVHLRQQQDEIAALEQAHSIGRGWVSKSLHKFHLIQSAYNNCNKLLPCTNSETVHLCAGKTGDNFAYGPHLTK